MPSDWNIQPRSPHCTATGRIFADGEEFFTLLLQDERGFSREDLCTDAWLAREPSGNLFSFWKSTFEAPPPRNDSEALEQRRTAEGLLRKLIEEDDADKANARFILAVLLERKKVLKPVESRETEDGRLLVYEHSKTGEVFLIPDPMLALDRVDAVQDEVGRLLGIPPKPAPDIPAGSDPEPEASSDAPMVS